MEAPDELSPGVILPGLRRSAQAVALVNVIYSPDAFANQTLRFNSIAGANVNLTRALNQG